jgi:hypothetical protein
LPMSSPCRCSDPLACRCSDSESLSPPPSSHRYLSPSTPHPQSSHQMYSQYLPQPLHQQWPQPYSYSPQFPSWNSYGSANPNPGFQNIQPVLSQASFSTFQAATVPSPPPNSSAFRVALGDATYNTLNTHPPAAAGLNKRKRAATKTNSRKQSSAATTNATPALSSGHSTAQPPAVYGAGPSSTANITEPTLHPAFALRPSMNHGSLLQANTSESVSVGASDVWWFV